MDSSSTETDPEIPHPAVLAAEEVRTAYNALLISLHDVIHSDPSVCSDPIFHALTRFGEAWAVCHTAIQNSVGDRLIASETDQKMTQILKTLPGSQDTERNLIRTLVAIAKYSRPEDETLALIGPVVNQIFDAA